MTNAMPIIKSLAAPAMTCVVMTILAEGGVDLFSLTVAFLVAMATISLMVSE